MKINRLIYWNTIIVAAIAMCIGVSYYRTLFDHIIFQQKSLSLSNTEAIDSLMRAGTGIDFYVYPVVILFGFFWGAGVMYNSRSK